MFDFLSNGPEFIISVIPRISLVIISSIRLKIFSEHLEIIFSLFSSKNDLFNKLDTKES